MNMNWKNWINERSTGTLTLIEFWHCIIPCLNSDNVSEAMQMIDKSDRSRFSEIALAANAEFIEFSSAWPPGPTSPEIKQGILALKNYFKTAEYEP
jgi:hypothetical protein